MKYEVIITPSFKTNDDVQFSMYLDNSKFLIDTSKASGLTISNNKYTILVPKNTEYAFHTGIFIEDNPDDTYTPELAEAILGDEAIIDPTIVESDTVYTYNTKIKVNGFTISFYVDNVLTISKNYAYGSLITIPSEPEAKVGYTFSGWNDVPTRMPSKNVNIYGNYVINSHKLTYIVDNKQYKQYTLNYDTEITPEALPTKTGYEFSGWSEIPSKMPDEDVTVSGAFTANEYTLHLTVDGVEVYTITGAYNSIIDYSSLATPEKTGYTFKEWSPALPTKMPYEDKTYSAVFTQNVYTITYMDGSTVLKTIELHYGDTIEVYDVPSKVGYTSNGWDVTIPSTMGTDNIVANAQYTINKHTVTFKSSGETYETKEVEYGNTIAVPTTNPSIVGYTFTKWDNVPTTMPDEDVTVNAVFTINKHTVTYILNGSEYEKFEDIEFGNTIPSVTTNPEEIGYTFSGWSEIPATMPDEDITITGTKTINSWTLTYVVDGVTAKSETLEYGTVIEPYNTIKEGYTFSGWDITEPTTMPDNDVKLTGTFTANSHKLIYTVDGTEYSSFTVNYGTELTAIEEPTKKGYTFSGWSEIPTTMPDNDVTVAGTFAINSYTLTFIVDGEVYETNTVNYGNRIHPHSEPTKEGYTFSGWSEIPETMPDYNVTITGTFTINTHTLTFIVSGETVSSSTVEYNSTITYPTIEDKDGYTFAWDSSISIMPDDNVTITGTYTPKEYLLTFIVSGETVSTANTKYGATITYPTVESISGYTFSWDSSATTMPSKDLTITGTYTEITNDTYVYYNCLLNSDIDSTTNYDGFGSILVKSGNTYDLNMYTPVPSINTDTLEDDEYDEWWENNHYGYIILIPSSISSFKLIQDSSDVTPKFTNLGNVEYNGNSYVKMMRKTNSTSDYGNELRKYSIEL